MNAKEASFNNSSKWEIVKNIIEVIPGILITVFLSDLVIESVHVGDIPGFVVTS